MRILAIGPFPSASIIEVDASAACHQVAVKLDVHEKCLEVVHVMRQLLCVCPILEVGTARNSFRIRGLCSDCSETYFICARPGADSIDFGGFPFRWASVFCPFGPR